MTCDTLTGHSDAYPHRTPSYRYPHTTPNNTLTGHSDAHIVTLKPAPSHQMFSWNLHIVTLTPTYSDILILTHPHIHPLTPTHSRRTLSAHTPTPSCSHLHTDTFVLVSHGHTFTSGSHPHTSPSCSYHNHADTLTQMPSYLHLHNDMLTPSASHSCPHPRLALSGTYNHFNTFILSLSHGSLHVDTLMLTPSG